jgi:uncharacterized protein YbgA (DUF1722 family)/uncharacterized protein YbbK (DUF523 family)
VPVCPEVEIGLGTPRESIRLVEVDGEIRLRGGKSGDDHTRAMRVFARRKVRELAGLELCGYILKSKSPSCGLFRLPVYSAPAPGSAPGREDRPPLRNGRGLFAEALVEGLPHLPVEEEGRLEDPRLRENFVERVFAYARLRHVFRPRWRLGQLVAFHAREKLLLLAHKPAAYQALGRLVARGKQLGRAELATAYQHGFMDALAVKAPVGRHVNVLQHIAGYFREHLDADSRQQLAQVIADYQAGLVPLIVPVTLVQFFARRFAIEYLQQQSYLGPHPKELMLRNHV